MLDQSFSGKNFRIIFDIANRNGLFVEDKLGLTSIRAFTNDIKIYGNLAKHNKKIGRKDLHIFFNEVKEQIRKNRDLEVEAVLNAISSNIAETKFKIALKQIKIPGGKNLYTIDSTPEFFFAIKQLQFNLSRLYGVKQSDRNMIVDQLKGLLENNFPKIIVRTDIKNFYESIDHTTLRKKINQDNLLTPKSRKLINQVLRSYRDLSGSHVGVPRGIGISAYLAEIYMRKIDQIIRQQPDVIYYARYVDDIIIILLPNPNKPKVDYLGQITSAIENNSDLLTNTAKTLTREILDDKNYRFDFLGYNFIIKEGVVKTKLTLSKYDKLKTRIETSFENYANLSVVNEKLARKILVWRIRFLTGNTRLANNKSKILIGIYYSNNFLTEKNQIGRLDGLLKREIHTKLSSASLKKRLCKYTFQDGFENRRFSAFTGVQFREIMKIWK
ncbi:Reverse transcriptase (RNA-dependent DNA polymerase) [Nonlabens sp. Hel1_33_55]|uniref:antiviral reverse transcriptase Drt3a n=1 Tax=Nonlabens sp. Hel1_33_55 TaxID=1336802 RepID=UPI000875C5F9|nr:antiviral reverse transcriptase Drt3a [Nonlabens sp. Hel1_33_55]SCY00415.1 Reverse transcriptase (RNA-dependent DNA polymerase) [Nonlabens sp. Hel1_33_55]